MSNGNNQHQMVYSSVYSGVHVLEMNCRSVAVMRRRDDSFLNATQILKVAGVDKGRRTKILEKEVQIGEHEKVQGGYGKYQGTWIPFERGIEIARQYGVEELLRPLLDYVPGPDDDIDTPKKRRPQPRTIKPSHSNDFDEIPPLAPHNGRATMDTDQSSGMSLSAANGLNHSFNNGFQNQLQQNLSLSSSVAMSQIQPLPVQHRPPPNATDRYRAILMSVFLNHENHKLPELLTCTANPPADLDIDMIIDDQGHTSLHWAAALARINVLRLLMEHGADPRRVNYNGESALIRAVFVTNNFDDDSFFELLSVLHSAIDIVDKKDRSVLHHIALTAGVKGRVQASRYYLEVLFDFMKKNKMDVGALIDRQDKNGDTALNIASRVNNYAIVELFLLFGADPDIPNRAGLRPVDFGVEDPQLAGLFQSQLNGTLQASMQESVNAVDVPVFGLQRTPSFKRSFYSNRGREMAEEFESVVSNMENEIVTKETQLQEALSQIKTISEELSNSRRVIQQLSTRLAQSQHQCRLLETKYGTGADLSTLTNVDALQMEVNRLKAIMEAHSIPEQEYSSDLGNFSESSPGASKAYQLIAKILDVPSVTDSMIDPLLSAVTSEKHPSALDTQMDFINQ